MSYQERKRKILEAVGRFESLSVAKLSKHLDISPATIRRDLNQLDEEKLLVRTHGGAVRLEDPPFTSFAEKQSQQNENKIAIAKKAASFVSKGDTIFMDCGSTVFAMCAYLNKVENLKVITNSLPVMAALIHIPTISLNLIGGELDKGRKAIHGERAVKHIDSYHVNKAFIGVDGISIKNGLTANSEKEATITSAFARNAKEVILLCDSSKIGKDSYLKFASLQIINKLITDNKLPAEPKKEFTAAGVNVIIANA